MKSAGLAEDLRYIDPEALVRFYTLKMTRRHTIPKDKGS